MKRCIWITLILALATHAVAATEPSMQRILATSPKVTVDPSNTAVKAYIFIAYSTAQGTTFRRAELDSGITAGSVYVPPGTTAQSFTMYQPVTAGSHYATITVDDNLTTDPVVKITNSGVLFNDSPSTYDDTALWTKFAEYMLKSEHDAYAAAVQAQVDAQNTQIAQLKAAMDAHGITVPGAAPATLDMLDFGTINVSTTKTLTTQIDNTGLGNLTMGTALPPSGTGASKFSVVGNCNNQVIPPSEHCIESIIFAPGTVAGTYTAQISFPHDATGIPTLLNVTGTAQAVQTCSSTPTVDISNMTAPADTPVGSSIYNVYNGIRVDAAQTTHTICKIGARIRSVVEGGVTLTTGSPVSTLAGIAYRMEIWSTDGAGNLLSMKRASNSVAAGSMVVGSDVIFQFASSVDYAATDAAVVTREDHGYSISNYINLTSGSTNTDGGYSHAVRYRNDFVVGAETPGAEKQFQLYGVQ